MGLERMAEESRETNLPVPQPQIVQLYGPWQAHLFHPRASLGKHPRRVADGRLDLRVPDALAEIEAQAKADIAQVGVIGRLEVLRLSEGLDVALIRPLCHLEEQGCVGDGAGQRP